MLANKFKLEIARWYFAMNERQELGGFARVKKGRKNLNCSSFFTDVEVVYDNIFR
jgi:hypothetical protein